MAETKSALTGSSVAIGKFEALHLGHQRILQELVETSRKKGLVSVVLTFENNPLSVLNPSVCPNPVKSPRQRAEEMRALGIERVVMLPFTKELAETSAEEFIEKFLFRQLAAKEVFIGDDFKFGKDALGDVTTLREHADRFGFRVQEIAEVTIEELGRVSSTRVRALLDEGDVAETARLLGTLHTVRGAVVHGDARGRELGFPTANLGPSEGLETVEGYVPKDGVYAGYVTLRGKRYGAAISVGNNPTFTPNEVSRVEAFILDFSDDIYGEEIEVSFLARVRDMERFDGIDELLETMRADVAKTRQLLAEV